MMDKRDTSFQSTRRRLLQGALTGLSFLGLGVSVAQAAKASPASVGYRGSPKGDQNCANCSLFISPNACKSVSGAISANGWCRIWKP
ncbi:MAG: high-potential iron-sulfur protein [Methylocystis sp.]